MFVLVGVQKGHAISADENIEPETSRIRYFRSSVDKSGVFPASASRNLRRSDPFIPVAKYRSKHVLQQVLNRWLYRFTELGSRSTIAVGRCASP